MTELQLPRINVGSDRQDRGCSERGGAVPSPRRTDPDSHHQHDSHGRLTDPGMPSKRQPQLPQYPRPEGPRRPQSGKPQEDLVDEGYDDDAVMGSEVWISRDRHTEMSQAGTRSYKEVKADRPRTNASEHHSSLNDMFLNDLSPTAPDRSVDRFDYVFTPSVERSELHDAMEASNSMFLHMVYVGTGADDPPRVLSNSRQAGSTRAHEVPSEAEAAVLLCSADYLDSACFVIKLLKKSLCSRPIICVILRPAHGVFLAKLSSIAMQLKKVGSDNVIMQPRDKQDLAERIQSALGFIGVRWQIEEELNEESDVKANSLFFEVVDQVIEGFPRLNRSMEERKATSKVLGGVGRHAFTSVLGEGKFGRVYTTAASGRPDAPCEAVKVICKRGIRTARHCNQILKECRLMQKVRHPNITEFRGLVHALLNMYIFMEFIGTMDLSGVIRSGKNGRLESTTILELFLQICDAVAYCHQMCVAHRDIKSENVVVTADIVPKLVDFGLAVPLKADHPPELCSDKCGTIPFAPPEVYRGKPFEASAMDVWGLGILTLEMRCGNNSVCKMLGCACAAEPNDELAEIVESFFSNQDWPLIVQQAYPGVGMAEELLVVMRNCLVVAPELRWRASDLWGHIAESRGSDRWTAASSAQNTEQRNSATDRSGLHEPRETNRVTDRGGDDARPTDTRHTNEGSKGITDHPDNSGTSPTSQMNNEMLILAPCSPGNNGDVRGRGRTPPGALTSVPRRLKSRERHHGASRTPEQVANGDLETLRQEDGDGCLGSAPPADENRPTS